MGWLMHSIRNRALSPASFANPRKTYCFRVRPIGVVAGPAVQLGAVEEYPSRYPYCDGDNSFTCLCGYVAVGLLGSRHRLLGRIHLQPSIEYGGYVA